MSTQTLFHLTKTKVKAKLSIGYHLHALYYVHCNDGTPFFIYKIGYDWFVMMNQKRGIPFGRENGVMKRRLCTSVCARYSVQWLQQREITLCAPECDILRANVHKVRAIESTRAHAYSTAAHKYKFQLLVRSVLSAIHEISISVFSFLGCVCVSYLQTTSMLLRA